MNRLEMELSQFFDDRQWETVFNDIRERTRADNFAYNEATKFENKLLNRYKDVLPYDHSRVHLQNFTPQYINASLVKAPSAERKYILTQGPLPSTVSHFWLMAWQQNSKAILMLNRVIEKGCLKCHQYWPMDQDETMTFEDVHLHLEIISSNPTEHYTVRRFNLTNTESKESREIYHFHYTNWPDFGVPQCPDSFLEYLNAVRNTGCLEKEAGPPIVHCSAGIGRSGTFCLVDTCLVLIAKDGPNSCCIKDILIDLRSYRMGLIQTSDQLKFSYLAIASGAHINGNVSMSILNKVQNINNQTSPDSDDNSPPLPPPRSQSLEKQGEIFELLASLDNGAIYNGLNIPSILSKRDSQNLTNGNESPSTGNELVSNSERNSTPNDGNSDEKKCILNNHKMEERKREMELRRRKKEKDRIRRELKIAEIKRKSRESDERVRRNNMITEKLVPFFIGMAMMSVGAYFYLK